MLLIYRLLINILYPFIIIFIYGRTFFKKEDKSRFKEKIFSSYFNINKNQEKKLIWFHAASIGEINSILPLIEKLNDIKNFQFLITTVTLSSSNLLKKRNLSKNIIHRFFPLDKQSLVKKFLDNWKPDLILFVESEIWPNFIFEIRKKEIPLILLNGRITRKTFNRWKFIYSFAKNIFQSFKICLTSNKETMNYLNFFKVKNIKYFGNLKLSLEKNLTKIDGFDFELFNHKRFWCAVSTHKTEEIFCLKTHLKIKKQYENVVTIIIPRHIHRSQIIKKECDNLNLRSQILNENEKIEKDNEIIIVNSYGSVSNFLNICKSVFIGKSLIKKLSSVGGQNPIEAAKFGCKIYHGPYIYNFKEVYELLNKMKFSENILNENDLAEKLIQDLKITDKSNDLPVENLNILGKKILEDTFKEIKRIISR